MVFYLGKDVSVTFNTESTAKGITPLADGTAQLDTGNTSTLAGKLVDAAVTTQADLTSVEVGIGAMDEDISYFGMRTALKAEIKKETTITLTRKKSNNIYEVAFDQCRYGIKGGVLADGLEQPTVEYGYRVAITLLASTEVLTIPNCVISGHTVSLNADGTTEETLELSSMVTPLIATTGETSTATLPVDL